MCVKVWQPSAQFLCCSIGLRSSRDSEDVRDATAILLTNPTVSNAASQLRKGGKDKGDEHKEKDKDAKEKKHAEKKSIFKGFFKKDASKRELKEVSLCLSQAPASPKPNPPPVSTTVPPRCVDESLPNPHPTRHTRHLHTAVMLLTALI
eukprot:6630815-Pyramimonas_sp.AAC.3